VAGTGAETGSEKGRAVHAVSSTANTTKSGRHMQSLTH
jgi:hypothetical protein